MRFLILLAIASLQACSVNPVTGNRDLAFMSEAKEVQTGKQYHPQILQQYGVYEDPKVQKYVNDIGQEMVKISHRKNLPFTFTVLDSPVINAFALPGGYVYITRGIMGYINSEAELAGVIGHEIGHVTARHGVRQQASQTLAGLGSILVGVATGSKELMDTAQIFGGALVSGYGRNHELESDRLGAEYLAKVGYRPQAMIDTISVLKDQEVFNNDLAKAEGREPQNYHGLFASHPRNDKRLQEVVKQADKYQSNLKKGDGEERYLQITKDMVFGDSPSQGIIREGKFYHPDLGFVFTIPKKWQLSNQPTAIIMASPNKDSQIQIELQKLDKPMTSQQVLTQRANASQNLSKGRIQPIALSHLQAHTMKAAINTQQGQLPARITAIVKDEYAYIIAGVAKDAKAFNTSDKSFISLIKSFHRISNSERVKAKPYRFKLIRATRGLTYEKLAAKSPIKTQAANRLRLLNGDYPNKQPATGRLIKIIE